MPIEKLTAAQLSDRPRGRVNNEYQKFIESLKNGEGGRASTKRENATKQTIKNRLKRAAQSAGVTITFLRSPGDDVIFRIKR
jgi:hypothetical protein